MLATNEAVAFLGRPPCRVDDDVLGQYIRREHGDFDPAWLRGSSRPPRRRKGRGRWTGRLRSWFASLTGSAVSWAAVPEAEADAGRPTDALIRWLRGDDEALEAWLGGTEPGPKGAPRRAKATA